MGDWTEIDPSVIGNATKKSDFTKLWNNVSFVQQVRTETGEMLTNAGTIPIDDSIPQSGEGYEYIFLAITPKNAANILLVEAVLFLSPAASDAVSVGLFKEVGGVLAPDAIAVAVSYIPTAWISPVTMRHYLVAGGTASITFRVRAGGATYATTLNGVAGARKYGGVLMSSLTITEIKP